MVTFRRVDGDGILFTHNDLAHIVPESFSRVIVLSGHKAALVCCVERLFYWAKVAIKQCQVSLATLQFSQELKRISYFPVSIDWIV
jgi:hypothetical protein